MAVEDVDITTINLLSIFSTTGDWLVDYVDLQKKLYMLLSQSHRPLI